MVTQRIPPLLLIFVGMWWNWADDVSTSLWNDGDWWSLPQCKNTDWTWRIKEWERWEKRGLSFLQDEHIAVLSHQWGYSKLAINRAIYYHVLEFFLNSHLLALLPCSAIKTVWIRHLVQILFSPLFSCHTVTVRITSWALHSNLHAFTFVQNLQIIP